MRKKKTAVPGHTLQDAISLFLAQYKKQSKASYGYNLNKFASFVGAGRPISGITEMHILEYQHYTEARGIAVATRATHFKMIKVFFNWLKRMSLVKESAARLLRVPRVTTRVDKDKAMTDDELKQILDWAKWHPRDYAIILFLADTGCRAGGAAGLRVGDIDFENLRAVVTEKGEKSRPVSFESVCARALKNWLARRPADAGEFVFSVKAEPLIANTISTIVRRACKHAGVRPRGSHSLRHRKGHQLAYGMVPPSLAAQALGHSNPVTTLTSYYPVTWAEADKIMRSFAVKEEDVSNDLTPQETPREKPRLVILRKGG